MEPLRLLTAGLMVAFLSACSLGGVSLENLDQLLEDPVHQCQIVQTREGEACEKVVGTRTHACQLNPILFSQGDGVPDFCTTHCLNRTDMLETIPAECLRIEVATISETSVKSDNVVAGPIYLEDEGDQVSFFELVEETEEMIPDLGDRATCLAEGKCWANNACIACTEGECQFDSDCDPVCRGGVLQQRGCNLQSAQCEDTFSKNCEATTTDFDGITYAQTCDVDSLTCAFDTTKLEEKYEGLKAEHQALTGAMQQATALYQDTREKCIYTAQEITSQLIIESANVLSGISSNAIKMFSSTLGNLIAEGLEATGPQNVKTNNAKFLVWACKTSEAASDEIDRLAAERDALFEQVELYDQQIKAWK